MKKHNKAAKTSNRYTRNDNMKYTFKRAINSEWQRKWENNISKLHYIKPRIEELESVRNSCKQYKVKFS